MTYPFDTSYMLLFNKKLHILKTYAPLLKLDFLKIELKKNKKSGAL